MFRIYFLTRFIFSFSVATPFGFTDALLCAMLDTWLIVDFLMVFVEYILSSFFLKFLHYVLLYDLRVESLGFVVSSSFVLTMCRRSVRDSAKRENLCDFL